MAPTLAERRESLGEADRLLADAVPFIAIAAPVRWLLVAPRLTGFQPNAFGRHAADQLVAPRRVAQGFQMVSVTMDTVALATASTAALHTVRAAVEATPS